MSNAAGASRLRVAIISDVSVGYGTPQVLRIAASLAQVYDACVKIFEPDEPERTTITSGGYAIPDRVTVERLYTTIHPHWLQGRIEYCAKAAMRVSSYRPDIILFTSMYGIELLNQVATERCLKVFYCLEEVDPYYRYLFPLVRMCDIMVFVEANRARLYTERLGDIRAEQDVLLLYNAGDRRPPLKQPDRLARMFYGGTFDQTATYGSYFLRPKTRRLPIDIYGLLRGFPDAAAAARALDGRGGGVRFCGYRRSDDSFFQLLSRYLYSIVIWNPDREDRLYACPNKLFDALSCGVPPIAAPHPQCVSIIRRWKCGILMDDWSYKSFRAALEKALRAAGSDYYAELVANCRRAVDEELSWARQFEKLAPVIDRHLVRLGLSQGRRIADRTVPAF